MKTPKNTPFIYITAILLLLVGSSCTKFEDYNNNARGNFEALWTIMDEHYCFFKEKQLDWNQVYHDYSLRVKDNMTNESLFYLLNDMLKEVKDGHVNLVSPFDVGRYDGWYADSAYNFDMRLIEEKYLERDYAIASGLRYRILEDNVGYVYYSSFSNGIGEGNLDHVIKKLEACHGIIIDIRNNGGGTLTNAEVLASRFTNERILIGYIRHKTGKGHNDFSEPYPRYLEPSTRLRYQKQVVLLTNRQCYSAANDFTSIMKQLPGVLVMGSHTGGGGGLPFSSELPNGWSVRFSASPMLNAEKQNIEAGIAPDVYVCMSNEELKTTEKDRVIETARAYIKDAYFN